MEFNRACGTKRKQRSELDSWIFKVHDHVCKHAIQLRISLKHLRFAAAPLINNMLVSEETSLISSEVE